MASHTTSIPGGSQTLAAVVRAYGKQQPTVRAAVSGGPKDVGYVAVTIGTTLTYCYDLPAVEAFARAWAEACTRPTHWLPRAAHNPAASTALQITLQVSVFGDQPRNATLITAKASPDRRPHLVVRVGQTTTVIYDQKALTDYRTAWAQALNYAQRIFTNPNPDAFDELENRIRKQEHRHFEQTGSLPKSR